MALILEEASRISNAEGTPFKVGITTSMLRVRRQRLRKAARRGGGARGRGRAGPGRVPAAPCSLICPEAPLGVSTVRLRPPPTPTFSLYAMLSHFSRVRLCATP